MIGRGGIKAGIFCRNEATVHSMSGRENNCDPNVAAHSPRRFPLDFILLFLLVFANLPREHDLEFGRMMADLGVPGAPGASFFARSLVDNPVASAQAAAASRPVSSLSNPMSTRRARSRNASRCARTCVPRRAQIGRPQLMPVR